MSCVLLAGCVLCGLRGIAAVAEVLAPFSHQAWSTEEGLPDPSVQAVLQTRDGYLWVATERGVARFDGSSFRAFRQENTPAFASADVGSMAEDAAGRLWFGTGEGLVVEQNGALRQWQGPERLRRARLEGLIAITDGSLLALTVDGLWRIRDESAMPVETPGTTVRGLEAGRDGAALVLLADGEVLRFRAGEPVAVQKASPHEEVLREAIGPDGARWVQTAQGLFAQGGEKRVHIWPESAAEASLRVTAMLPEAGGTGWIGTNHGLFYRGSRARDAVVPVDALRGEPVLSLHKDREGDVWVGTEGAGLHVLRPRAFRSVGAAAGEAVTSVVSDEEGGFWFGTREAGVEHVLRDGRTVAVPAAAMTSPRVLSIALGMRGEVWVGTPDGLNLVRGGTVARRYSSAEGLPDDFVRSLAVDSQGTVWMGTRRGLASLDSRNRITTWTTAEGLPSDSIGPLLPGAPGTGELWVGTSQGLALMRGGRVLALPGAARGSIVTAMRQDGAGGLWLGVHGVGLQHWSGGALRPVPLGSVPQEITALERDERGSLWMRGPQEVVRGSGAALLACARDSTPCAVTLDHFDAADGMPSSELAAAGTPQIAMGSTGELWFSTRRGLAVADPGELPPTPGGPPVVVQRLVVDGVALEGDALQLGPGHSRFVFDYAALSFRLPSKVRYRYRLDGFDRDWVEAGTARSAYYTALPPRSYRFRVVAEAGDSIWSAREASLAVQILPPFYRRWWFALVVALLLGVLVMGTLRLRDRVIQRRFALVLEERNRMAREIHDTLAQDFVSMSLQLDLAASHLRGERYTQAAEQLQTTRTQVKEGLRAARQSIWNLRANAGEDSLPTRLAALAGRYRFGEKAAQVTIGGTFRRLAATVEEEVLRIAGEALSNAHRHAGADEVQVELRYSTEVLRLWVRDDGRGFAPAVARQAEGHYGVRGLYERAAALGAELRMDSSPGEGTTVLLEVPLRGREVSQA